MTQLFQFKPDDEAGRLAAVARYEILDTAPESDFQEIIALIKKTLGMPIAAISLIASDRQWFKAQIGLDTDETSRKVAFCDHTIRTEAPMKITDATRDPRFADNPNVMGGPGIRSYLGVPLRSPDGYNIGALCVMGTEPREFTPADLELLHICARLVMSQMELRLLARRDGLTGTLTRRAFEEHLRQAFHDTDRSEMSLVLLDIDHFKRINDQFGHPVGDAVLKTVARALSDALRKSDIIGRYGGEEFAILLRNTAPQDAESLTERLRARIEASVIAEIAPQAITASFGISHSDSKIDSIEAWIEHADAALYKAKQRGRNRVVVAE